MQLVYTLLLFVVTFAGGSIPLWVKGLDDKRMNYLLAFSGSFLLGITFLHLLPEAFSNIGGRAGFYLLIGFFIQLLIQRITPLAGILANTLGTSYPGMTAASAILVPVVAGAFIHIATTIFYESGTKQHTLSTQKILAILIGVSLAFITLIFE